MKVVICGRAPDVGVDGWGVGDIVVLAGEEEDGRDGPVRVDGVGEIVGVPQVDRDPVSFFYPIVGLGTRADETIPLPSAVGETPGMAGSSKVAA